MVLRVTFHGSIHTWGPPARLKAEPQGQNKRDWLFYNRRLVHLPCLGHADDAKGYPAIVAYLLEGRLISRQDHHNLVQVNYVEHFTAGQIHFDAAYDPMFLDKPC